MLRRAACLVLLAALSGPSGAQEDSEARVAEDARIFEDFTVRQLTLRGVPGKKLGRDFREHLHATVLPAARQAPDEFAELPRYAAELTKEDITELFLVLKDRPDELADLVRGLLARLRRSKPEGEAPKEDKPSQGYEGSPIPKAILERWLAHKSILEGVTLDVLLGRMTSRYEEESELKSAGAVAAYATLKALGPSLDDVGGRSMSPPAVSAPGPVPAQGAVSESSAAGKPAALKDLQPLQAR